MNEHYDDGTHVLESLPDEGEAESKTQLENLLLTGANAALNGTQQSGGNIHHIGNEVNADTGKPVDPELVHAVNDPGHTQGWGEGIRLPPTFTPPKDLQVGFAESDPEDEDDDPGDTEDDYITSDQRAKALAKAEHEAQIAEMTMEVGKLAREMSRHRSIANGLASQIKGLNEKINKLEQEGPDYRPLLDGRPFPNAPTPAAVLQKPPADDPQTPPPSNAWRKVDIRDLGGITPKFFETLSACGIETMGDFADKMAKGVQWYRDCKDIGQTKAGELEAKFTSWLETNRDGKVFAEARQAAADRIAAEKAAQSIIEGVPTGRRVRFTMTHPDAEEIQEAYDKKKAEDESPATLPMQV